MRYGLLFLIPMLLLIICLSEREDFRIKQIQDGLVAQNLNESEDYERVIVLFREKVEGEIIEEADGVVINEAETINMASAYIPRSDVELLEEHPDVISVEKDKVVRALEQKSGWGNEQILVARSHQSNLTGKGIKVAVIDTGISPHEDLTISGGASFVSYTDSFYDDNGHGTHIAGIIAAKDNNIGIVGVAPDSQIYSLKVLNQDGLGYLSGIISAIEWSISNNMDIINLSLGMNQHSAALQEIVDNAYSHNILVVAAGGNNGNADGIGDTVLYPARYPSTIAVAATDEYKKRASFSATGSPIEISAPGVNIYSTYLNNKYGIMQGTSMAAPYVVGALALLKESKPTLKASELRKVLNETAIDLGASGRDEWFGHGVIQTPLFLTDIFGHWAYNDITSVYSFGWMRGTSSGIFSPNLNLSRAQAAAILVRALGLEKIDSSKSAFHDIEGHWAQEEIEVISQHQIMRGVTEHTFSPQTAITRQQMATIIARVLQLTRTGEMSNPYIDVVEGHWATNEIIAATHHQIFRGLSPNSFGGEAVINRAQMATLMNRISNQIKQ